MQPRLPCLSALLALLLLGCAAQPASSPAPGPAPGPAPVAGNDCDADAAQAVVGQTYTPELAETAAAAAGADTVRRLAPGTQVTLEFQAGRLNLDTDEAGRVTRVHCG